MAQNINVLYQSYEEELREVLLDNFEGRPGSRRNLSQQLKQLKRHPNFDPKKLEQVVLNAHRDVIQRLEVQGKL
jgi:hypothetical protein